MKLWIGVEVFSLIVQDVHVFKSEEEADKWFKEYTGYPYEAFYTEDGPADQHYDETKIFEVEIDIP